MQRNNDSGGDTIDDQQMSAFRQKVCILGTHHAYQYQTKRRGYDQNVRSLIQIHSVDLVAEEATGVPNETYAKRIADDFHILWMNVDLSREERQYVPDINQAGFGTLFDFELQLLREWVWVIRTAKAVKRSALLICGWVHITGVAEKFWRIGFDVETNLYFDRRDDKIAESIE
jgi:hypothetical protein